MKWIGYTSLADITSVTAGTGWAAIESMTNSSQLTGSDHQ